MKKFYFLITLMLMCFIGTGTIQAQHKWTIIGENLAEGALVAGEDHFYAIQSGDNTNLDGSLGQFSYTAFLSSNEWLDATTSHESIWNFIETGEEQEGFKVYVLKNVANDKYLSDLAGRRFTDNIDDAFRFTARKAVSSDESAIENDSIWLNYSCATSNTRSVKAETMGAWVLCSPYEKTYMGFFGNPSFSHYIDTNNWFIYSAEEQTMSAYEKFEAIFNQYFSNGIDEIQYPIGTNPGCMSQENFDRLMNLYTEAESALANPNTPAEDCDRLRIAIVNMFEVEIPKNIIPVGPGFFVLKNVDTRGFLTEIKDGVSAGGSLDLFNNNTTEGTDYNNWTPDSVTVWNKDNAAFIWEVETSSDNGQYYLKNLVSGKYLSANKGFQMSNYPAGTFDIKHYAQTEFYLMTENGLAHMTNYGSHKLIIYNNVDDKGSRFKFYTINKETVDSLKKFNGLGVLYDEMKTLVEQTRVDFQYTNFVEADSYKQPADNGLVTKVLEANSWATNEGSLEALFDGDKSTYFHTAWSSNDVINQGTTGTHWIKMDLGKEVQELVVKFTKRNVTNNHIRKYALYTSADGSAENAEWNQLVATSADTIDYAYGKNNTHIATYKLDKPVRYIRFEVLGTSGLTDTQDRLIEGTGPLWHLAELRMYDKSDIATDPTYNSVPVAIKDVLKKAFEAAEAELDSRQVTQATFENLKKARTIFLEACAGSNRLFASDVTSAAGQQVVLPIEMQNTENICGFQFDLFLPQGVTVAKDEDGYDLIELATDRTSARKHVVESNMLNDGSTRVLCYSGKNEIFSGKSGKVINVTLNVAPETKDGTYYISMKNIVLTTPSLNRYTTPETKSSIYIKSYTLGDVNNDYHIDVTDVAGVVNYVLGHPSESLVKEAADINKDNILDVTDVAGVVNIILSRNNMTAPIACSTMAMQAVERQAINLEVLPFTLKANEEKEIEVLLNNPGDAFTGAQFDLYLPEGVTVQTDEEGYHNISVSNIRSKRHTVESEEQKDGAVRVIIYSGKNTNFKGENGGILSMTLCGSKDLKDEVKNVEIKNIVLARANVTNNKPANYIASILAGNPIEEHIALQGDFTAEALQEFSTALNGNQKITSVDLTNAIQVAQDGAFTTGNPNTLIYLAEGMRLANVNNVITQNRCEKLVLADNFPFFAKQAFIANTAEFNRNTVENDWYSICLPFAANLPANTIVEQFVDLNEDLNIANFEDATALLANTPYLFKATDGMTQFHATNAEVSATETQNEAIFMGTINELAVGNVAGKYVIKADGSVFERCVANQPISTFSAFLNMESAVDLVHINHGKLSGIENIENEKILFPANIYTIDGKLVKKQAHDLNGLTKGIYIVNGKKFVK